MYQAAETPMNKRSRKKFTGKQKTKSSESNHEEAADLEPEVNLDYLKAIDSF